MFIQWSSFFRYGNALQMLLSTLCKHTLQNFVTGNSEVFIESWHLTSFCNTEVDQSIFRILKFLKFILILTTWTNYSQGWNLGNYVNHETMEITEKKQLNKAIALSSTKNKKIHLI